MISKHCKVCLIALDEKNHYTSQKIWLCKKHYYLYIKEKSGNSSAKARKKYELKNNKTPHRKKQLVEITKRMREKYPEKNRAREQLRHAVKIGEIIKPLTCEKCNENKQLQGHHENYNKALEVMWLCKSCHTARHKELNKKP